MQATVALCKRSRDSTVDATHNEQLPFTLPHTPRRFSFPPLQLPSFPPFFPLHTLFFPVTMARYVTVLSLTLVVMLIYILCVTERAEARSVPRSSRHAHRAFRGALISKRASSSINDCPESKGDIASYVKDQIHKLSSASEKTGGQEQVVERDLPGANGDPHVQVRVKSSSSPNGSSRSWSWSWSSHSSSSSSSSSSDNNAGHSSPVPPQTEKQPAQPQEQHKAQPREQNEKDSQPQKPSDPTPATAQQQTQPVQRHTEVHSSHSQHTSHTTRQLTRSVQDKDGHITSLTSTIKSHSSSSTSSYVRFSNVFHYVIAGHADQSSNIAPFSNAQVEWMRSPIEAAALSAVAQIGEPIPRPARADICNRRFPFTGQQYTIEDKDHRFNQPFPKEALDPVSKIALDLHNAERARYGLQPLQWNVELANMAACWADLKAYGHSQDHFCASGENIAMGLGDPCYSNPSEGMKNAVMSFLDEDRNWAQSPHESESTGHWTQAVWKDTRFLGCAVAQRKDFMQGYSADDKASMYVVCEYYPPGNVAGQFEHQVPAVRPMPQLRSSCSANEKHGS